MIDRPENNLGNPYGIYSRTVINSSREKAFWSLVFSLVIMFLLINYYDSPGLLSQIFRWGIIGLWAPGVLYLLLSISLRIPKIILNQDGMKFISFVRGRSWKWPEVGPFSVDVKRGRQSEYFYVCAFTDSNYDLLHTHNLAGTPSLLDADIKFALKSFSMGDSRNTAEEFAGNLNIWRDKFGRPEIEIDQSGTVEKARSLRRKIQFRTVRYYIYIFVPVALVLILFSNPNYFMGLIKNLL